MCNIIRVDEGGVSTPYIVHERFSQFAEVKVPEGMKLIREQRGGANHPFVDPEAYLLLCEPIKDAVWEDIETPKIEPPPTEDETLKGQNVDITV